MKYFKNIKNIIIKKKLIIILGNFDGIHLGHEKLLKKAINKNIYNEYFVLLITFNPNPKKINYKVTKYLTTLKEKKYLINKYKINALLILNFNNRFSLLTKKEFLKDMIFKYLKINTIIVGYNFRFGRNAKGDNIYLKKECIKYNCNLEIIPKYKFDGIIVNSTKIRSLVENGYIEKANKLLGYNYIIIGKVIHGEHIGEKIGFPTANIKIEKDKLLPKLGVYIIKSNYKNKIIYGISNIGYQPTFKNNKKLKIEINILNFNENIYGKYFVIEILHRMRNEIKFKNKQELKNQLKIDKKKALKYIKKLN